MLIKKTKSLCPICGSVVDSNIIEEENKIWIDRTCPVHGSSRDLYWSDSTLYHRFESYEAIGEEREAPQVSSTPKGCNSDCGICKNHRSQTLLANIDLTNRCNLTCEFCFANARACGFIYEPSFSQVVSMMKMLRETRPVPTPAIQFSGGEPTLRHDLVEIVKKAKELGFPQIQLATNGILLAKEPQLAQNLRSAGMSTVYLHFDGVSEETNPLLAQHREAIKNLKKADLGIVLVPTVIKGKNDHELGEIIRFACENISIIRGVNFQPVSFTGAARHEDITIKRITIPDLLERIETQMEGRVKKSDFYPVPSVLPISELVEAYTGRPQVKFTAHQHCGAATYLFVNKVGDLIPITKIVSIERLLETVKKVTATLKKGGALNRYKSYLEGLLSMKGIFNEEGGEDTQHFKSMILKSLVNQDYKALGDFHKNALFIGTMHFMDNYNYDLERVSRCCIHYATPDGRLIPFCTYNSGPVYREEVWKRHAQRELT